MSQYTITQEAELDLVDIWDHIALDNFDAADAWVEKLRESIKAIGLNPGIGHKRADLTKSSVLFWPVGSYLIVYRTAEGYAEILAVAHGARVIPAFLAGREI